MGGTTIPLRLRRDRDIRRALTEGQRWQDRLLALRALRHQNDAGVWLGVVLPRVSRRATTRNRVKRWIREDLREILRTEQIVGGWWLVVIPRTGAMTAAHAAVHQSLRRLLQEAGITAAAGRPD